MKMYTKVENRDWEDVSIGSSLAHSGKTLTDEHKKKIAQSLLERGSGKKYVIQAKNAIDGRIVIFENGQDAADKLKCSRQLISQCLRREARNNHQHSAKGWILTKIYIDEEEEKQEKANED